MQKIIFVFIFILAFTLRINDLSFPFFTVDEARISYRGYTLSHFGKDELGRSFPVLFNASDDYKLPVVSYLSAASIFVFGKNDFGARIAFILIGSFIPILIYKICFSLFSRKDLSLITALIITFSPVLIFLSKIPNEPIVLLFLFSLFFLLMLKKLTLRKNILLLIIILFVVLTSKLAWLVLLFLIPLTIFIFNKNLNFSKKISLSLILLIIPISAFIFYMNISQARRSINENNISLFYNLTIENGLNRLRGEGLEEGINPLFEKILFNKSAYIFAGFMHWLDQLQPAVFFGEFDPNGYFSFSNQGVFQKILVIPFILGLWIMIQKKSQKTMLLFLYSLVLTFPANFKFPQTSKELIILVIPIYAIIIAHGFLDLKRLYAKIIIFIVVLELVFLFSNFASTKMNTNTTRPEWVISVLKDSFDQSLVSKQVYISDDITSDLITYFQWHNPVSQDKDTKKIPLPYKVKSTMLGNIQLLRSQDTLESCDDETKTAIFLGSREINKATGNYLLIKTYVDSLRENRAYFLRRDKCNKLE